MKLLNLLIGITALVPATACNGLIYDDEGDCEPKYRVEFAYDWNMKYANAFSYEVPSVTLYVLDQAGKTVWTHTESGELLTKPGWAMELPNNLKGGTYDLLAWAGSTELGSWTVTPDLGQSLTRTIEAGEAVSRVDIDRLYNGMARNQQLTDSEGVYTKHISLKKFTNNVKVVLQHINGSDIKADNFDFYITGMNGDMDREGNLTDSQPITCHAWRTVDAVAGVDPNADNGESRSQTQWAGALAELTIPRLVLGQTPRLVVTQKGMTEPIISVPFIDYALLIKGFYNSNMDDQEYLDRQDEYNLTFFLDNGERWINSFIFINSWRVVLQNQEL